MLAEEQGAADLIQAAEDLEGALMLLAVQRFGAGHGVLDLGTTEEYYGIPWSVVPVDQPEVTIEYGTDGADYSDESDPGPYPFPPGSSVKR